MNRISAIYKIHSKIKPKRIYIGSSLNVTKRWNHHLNDLRNGNHHSMRLQNHYNKYGESDLEFTILLGCDTDNILDIEQYFLDLYKPYFNIYQTTRFYSTSKQSEKSNRKRSRSMTGKKWTLEARQRFSKQLKGKRVISQEARRKISESLKGNIPGKKSQEALLRLSESRKGKGNPMYGKHSWNSGMKMNYSEEKRRKISEAHKGKVPWNKGRKGVSEETRLKMSVSATGKKRKRTPEHQRKLSESRKRNSLLRKLENVA